MSIYRRDFLKCTGIGSIVLSMLGLIGAFNGEIKKLEKICQEYL